MISYPSGTEGLLAVERKEADGTASVYSSLKPYINGGQIRPLIRGRISASGIESLPVDEDLTTDKRGKTIMALRSAAGSFAWPYVTPPKTPPEVMKIIRNAFAQVTKDPLFLAEADKYGMAIEYVTAEESMKILNFIFSQPDDIVRDFGRFIRF